LERPLFRISLTRVSASFLAPDVLAFAALRLGLALAVLVGLALLWRRARPLPVLGLLLAVQVLAWLAYRAPLQRSYALAESSDRGFNLGMWAAVTQGVSPLEHTQRGFASPEPLWNLIVPALALGRIDGIALAYDVLGPLALLLVAGGIVFGLRPQTGDDDAQRWERVFMAFGVLGLASFSLAPRAPVPPFWAGNFMLKPHHACAFGLVAVVAGCWAREPRRALRLGAWLGLLGWAYLMSWAYLVVGLGVSALLWARGAPAAGGDGAHARPWRAWMLASLVSLALLVPYAWHLLGDLNPLESHQATRHMWNDPRGLPLAVPTWATLDAGPVLSLACVGLWIWWRRGRASDRALRGLLLGALGLWLLALVGALVGVAPEPDELYYYLRFLFGLAAGSALAALARLLAAQGALSQGHAALLVLALALPASFTSYWDPPSMDRYYANSRRPLSPKVLAYGAWVRTHTTRGAVFVAGRAAATWIPVLAGRQVLLAEGGQLWPRDYAARKRAERILLLSDDPGVLRATAERFGIDYVAIDDELVREYQVAGHHELAREPLWLTVYANSAVRIAELAPR
jgi:hypothetical protein